MGLFIFFLEKITSCTGSSGSGLKSIFHWYTHWEIVLRSRFKYLADSLESWAIEKRDVSSANNLAVELSPSGRSLIYIKKSRVPSTDPCGTPVLTGCQLYSLPFNNTLWNLLERLSNFPRIPKDSSLNKSPWCQTLSRDWDKSKNIPLILSDGLQLNARYVSCVIEINWLIQLSLPRKPDWLILRRFSRSLSFKRLWYIAFLKILLATRRSDTGL